MFLIISYEVRMKGCFMSLSRTATLEGW